MQIIDSHTHIDFDEFKEDRNDVIQRAHNTGVDKIIISSTVSGRWSLIKNICEQNKFRCYPAYGLHPMFMGQHKINSDYDDIDNLKEWLNQNYSVAIGEIGLDFYIEEADEKNKKKQIELFNAQLDVASEFKLPVIIHARKSLDIVLKHLRRFPTLQGSIHSFSGSLQQANQLMDLGFYLSFGGPITYDRATRLHHLIKTIPLDYLLVETDSPDQPSSEHHAKRNEPSFIHEVIEKIAKLKNRDKESIALETTKNAIKLFKLDHTL